MTWYGGGERGEMNVVERWEHGGDGGDERGGWMGGWGEMVAMHGVEGWEDEGDGYYEWGGGMGA